MWKHLLHHYVYRPKDNFGPGGPYSLAENKSSLLCYKLCYDLCSIKQAAMLGCHLVQSEKLIGKRTCVFKTYQVYLKDLELIKFEGFQI